MSCLDGTASIIPQIGLSWNGAGFSIAIFEGEQKQGDNR